MWKPPCAPQVSPGSAVRTVLSPAWTTDWMSQAGHRKLREYGIAPPGRLPAGARCTVGTGVDRSDPVGQVPALRFHQHQGDQPVRVHAVQIAVVLPVLRRTLRLLQGHLMTTTQSSEKPGPTVPTVAPGRRHAVFHPLRVASVDRLTEDSVAITFDVPEELRDEFRFNPGQHLSVRADRPR